MEGENTIRVGSRQKRVIIIFMVCILVGIGVVAFWPREREPEYKGKKLSQWLREYHQPLAARAPIISQEAVDAVRHIGTNGLPFLVRCIRDDKDMPRWRTKLFDAAYTLNSQSSAKTRALEIIAQRQLLGERATSGFQILGQRAGPAIPELTQVARNGNELSAVQALTALSYVGKSSLPALLALANDRNFKWRIQAIGALGGMGRLGTNAHPLAVSLIDYLKEPDPKILCATANVLGRLNLESEASVPALAELIKSADAEVRERSLANLSHFGDRARPVLPQVLAALRDSDADVRRSATNALQMIAPEVLTNGATHF